MKPISEETTKFASYLSCEMLESLFDNHIKFREYQKRKGKNDPDLLPKKITNWKPILAAAKLSDKIPKQVIKRANERLRLIFRNSVKNPPSESESESESEDKDQEKAKAKGKQKEMEAESLKEKEEEKPKLKMSKNMTKLKTKREEKLKKIEALKRERQERERGKGPYPCPNCGINYLYLKGLKRHFRKSHKDSGPLSCPLCRSSPRYFSANLLNGQLACLTCFNQNK